MKSRNCISYLCERKLFDSTKYCPYCGKSQVKASPALRIEDPPAEMRRAIGPVKVPSENDSNAQEKSDLAKNDTPPRGQRVSSQKNESTHGVPHKAFRGESLSESRSKLSPTTITVISIVIAAVVYMVSSSKGTSTEPDANERARREGAAAQRAIDERMAHERKKEEELAQSKKAAELTRRAAQERQVRFDAELRAKESLERQERNDLERKAQEKSERDARDLVERESRELARAALQLERQRAQAEEEFRARSALERERRAAELRKEAEPLRDVTKGLW